MVASDQLAAVLRHGLVQGSSGSKDNSGTQQADEFLNQHCPTHLSQAGVDRRANVYGYLLAVDGRVIDIADGEIKAATKLVGLAGHSILRVQVLPDRCYVSDLDAYDAVRQSLDEADDTRATELAAVYWRRLTRLVDYNGALRRPEVAIIYDVPPTALRLLG